MSEILGYLPMLLLFGFGWFGSEWARRRERPHVKITEHSSVDGKLITLVYEGPPEGLPAARRVRDAMKELP